MNSQPLSLFEMVGSLGAFLQARVQIGIDMGLYSIWKTVWSDRLAEIPIFEFSLNGSQASGTASNGYLNGTTVFFDANKDGRIDSIEPYAVLGDDAHFDLHIDHRSFDRNGNGSIELSEVLNFFGVMGTSEGDELSRLFAKMDTSGSGALDLVQLSALIKEFGVRMGLRDALETKDTPAGASALISPRGPETTSRRPRRSSNPDVFAVSRRPSLADVSALQRTSRLTRETECVLGGTY